MYRAPLTWPQHTGLFESLQFALSHCRTGFSLATLPCHSEKTEMGAGFFSCTNLRKIYNGCRCFKLRCKKPQLSLHHLQKLQKTCTKYNAKYCSRHTSTSTWMSLCIKCSVDCASWTMWMSNYKYLTLGCQNLYLLKLELLPMCTYSRHLLTVS